MPDKSVEEYFTQIEDGINYLDQVFGGNPNFKNNLAAIQLYLTSFKNAVRPTDGSNALQELLEIGARSEGPFTDNMISLNRKVRASVEKLLENYSGENRFLIAMASVKNNGSGLSDKQVRAAANLIYAESKNVSG